MTFLQRTIVLFTAFIGLAFSGVQLGIMPLAGLSASRSLMGDAFEPASAGDWFARYTAAMMLGGACGGMALGSLGDRVGRTRAMGLSILVYSLFGGLGSFAQTQEQLLALRFLSGLGVGGMWPNGVALVAECWANASRPLVAGVAGMGINVGILLVSQFGQFFPVTPETWRSLLLASSASALVGLFALLATPESPRWLAARSTPGLAAPSSFELFRPPLLHVTLVGIVLGAIPLIGAWGASKWMIPWADQVGGSERPGLKATTQAWWAVGAILGSFCGAQLAGWLGRRASYALISLGAVALTSGIFLALHPLHDLFLSAVFCQGLVTTLFFGWLPLYLPELFPTRVRGAGAGIAFNFGRFASAAGALGAGFLMAWSGGNYPLVGFVTGLVYALGMIAIWFAPETRDQTLRD